MQYTGITKSSDQDRVPSVSWLSWPNGAVTRHQGVVITESGRNRYLGHLPEFRLAALRWRHAGPSIIRPDELAMWEVRQLYTLRRDTQVSAFIERYSFLLPLLWEVHAKLEKYFDRSPELFLEVVADPEEPGHRQLFVYVGVSLSPDEALDRLGWFDREWWLDNLELAMGKLCIDVECI